MGLDRAKIEKIKERYSVLEYARDILGLPVQRSGDRCKSFAPGEHKTNNAFVAYEDWWYDFSQACGGDVIDLCAIAKHGGDKGAAIRELAGEDIDWKNYTQDLCDKIAYWHSQLRESDRHYLYRRGIKKETVDALRIGYDEKEDRLTIPYYKNGYVAYYIGRDRSGKENVSKYKKAYLDGLNENIAWGLDTLDRDKNFIVIAEGAFDAMSFWQEGYKVLSPISGYFSKKETLKQVISACKNVDYVFVCFDSDNAGSRFTVNMCQDLFKHRIKFMCGILPEGVKDVSEYYEAGGNLEELIKNAQSGITMLANRITDEDEFKDFVYKSARFVDKPDMMKFIKGATQFDKDWVKEVLKEALKMPPESVMLKEILSQHELKYVEEQGFYEYQHGVWKKQADNVIKGYFSDLLGQYKNGSKLSSLIKLLEANTTTTAFFNRNPIFNFRNCILELETGKTRPQMPSDMSSIQMTYDYDENAKCERWEKFIKEIMKDREPSIKLIQEMCGYILFSDCKLQKCFFLMGDGSNGKSVFLNTLKAVFNKENVSSIEMSGLASDFQRMSLINSLVNISTETSTDVSGAESYFKQVATGETINACYKCKDFVQFEPRCKMITACNEFISTRDTTDGFLRRMLFIDFPCKFEGGKADINLETKLKEELAGIFNWIYEGYKRLKEQQHFTETPEQVEMLGEFEKISDPIRAFIDEELKEYTGRLTRNELYLKYKTWTEAAGHNAQARTKFIRNFKTKAKRLLPNMGEVRDSKGRYFDFSGKYPEITGA